MFINRPRSKTQLEEAIEEAFTELKGYEATTDEYAKIVDRITQLHEMQSSKKTDRVSKDALIAAAANLLGIAVIVSYEQKHVITSKAFGLLSRSK